MAACRPDAEIDRLYQLPIDEFTAARNLLAKASGPGAADIRALVKPPVAAWAVNQLYWHHRNLYDALIEASEQLRRAHAAVLAGRGADVRATSKQHEERLDAALKGALSILEESGHPATDATRHALTTTLRALPSDEPAGRLTQTLQPGGFEMLAGLSIGGGKSTKASIGVKPTGITPTRPEAKGPARAVDSKALAKAREAAAARVRALRQAEHTAQREEFERARAAREADRTAKAVQQARQAVEDAQRELREAEVSAAAALRARETAERRARQAEQAVEAARARAESAQREVEGK